jgi:hypothetical protein
VTLNKRMRKNESAKRHSKDKASRMKHQICYTCRDKCHLSKNCPKTQTFIHKVVRINISHLNSKNDTSIIKMISSSCNSPRAIWIPKHLLTNHEGPNKAWVPKLLDQVVGGLRCIGSLTINKKMIQIDILSRA